MNKKDLKKAKKLARASIYDSARHAGVWNGCDIYEPTTAGDDISCTGWPQFIVIKDGKARWTEDWRESRDIMDALNTKD